MFLNKAIQVFPTSNKSHKKFLRNRMISRESCFGSKRKSARMIKCNDKPTNPHLKRNSPGNYTERHFS